MAQGGWGQGPIEIGRGAIIHVPSFLQSRARMVRLIVIAVAVLALLLTGYYQVEPDEVAVVQRFGKFVRTTDPGPHVKIPFGVETVTKVPVKRTLKMEFGFRTASVDVQPKTFRDMSEADTFDFEFNKKMNRRLVFEYDSGGPALECDPYRDEGGEG